MKKYAHLGDTIEKKTELIGKIDGNVGGGAACTLPRRRHHHALPRKVIPFSWPVFPKCT